MTKTTALTITKATSQARRLTDRIMPGAMATVESRGSWDLETDTALMVTTITHPVDGTLGPLLAASLRTLAGVVQVDAFPTRIVVTRTR